MREIIKRVGNPVLNCPLNESTTDRFLKMDMHEHEKKTNNIGGQSSACTVVIKMFYGDSRNEQNKIHVH